MKSPITTHVLDTAAGTPAAGIDVRLFRLDGASHNDADAETGHRNSQWTPGEADLTLCGQGQTDEDGRVMAGLISSDHFKPGVYRIEFATSPYLRERYDQAFYPVVTITFEVSPDQSHYHIPLLLSPFGFTTYRGS